MNIRRVTGIAALVAASAMALAAPTVGAQTATYGAQSDGRALALNLFGQGLTAGQTHSEVSSAPSAVATGTGILNPISPFGASAAADPAADLPDGATATEGEQCGGALPAELGALGLAADFACSTSSADASVPNAASDSRVGTIALNPVGALNDTPLSAVIEGVAGGVDQVREGLTPVLEGIDGGAGLDTETFLSELFDALFNGIPLATLTLGDTSTESSATATAVTTTCTAEGARIDILDAAPIVVDQVEVDPPPLVSVVVGEAKTTVSADLASGVATAAASPAIATVRTQLGGPLEEIPIGPGDAQTIELPAPLGNIVISVAGTIETDNEDGSKQIQASAVRIHLFEGSEELMDGIELALADCTSVAGGSSTTPTTAPPETTTTTAPSLPRTGGTGANGFALAGAAGLALVGLTLLRRSQAA